MSRLYVGSSYMYMKLQSERLSIIASLVEQNHIFADVGTDHAHIPSYLILNGISPSGYAGDIKQGPLTVAKNNLSQHGIQDKVQLVLCDGLYGFPLDKIDDIIIAGMGGDTIIGIIDACKDISERHRIILQPMTNVPKVRSYLFDNGYNIIQERIVCEDLKIYNVLVAVKSEKLYKPSIKDVYYGVNINSPELIEKYIKYLKTKHKKHYDGLIKAKKQNTCDIALEKSVIEMLEEL